MSDIPITPAQTDALAKLAGIPPAGSEEIAAALFESDNPDNKHLTWSEWLAYAAKHGTSTVLWKEINDCRRRAGVVLTLMSEARKQGQRDALGRGTKESPGVLWSAWPETDADSDPSDPGVTYCTEWFVGRWPIGAVEPDCRILIGSGRDAEIIARRVSEKLTSILNTDAILAALATGGARHG